MANEGVNIAHLPRDFDAQEVLNAVFDLTNLALKNRIADLVPGVAATNLGKAEDAAHASGDVGVMILGVRKNTAIALAGTDGDYIPLILDTIGALHVNLANLIAGEDLTNDVIKVEQRFSSSGPLTADTLVKTGAGFLHSVTVSPDAAPTIGTITLYDNTAESGTVLVPLWIASTTWFAPFTLILDIPFTTGLYIGFTTTADVTVVASYR